MKKCKVTFYPQNKVVSVEKGTSLLEAVSNAHITINNLCGGDGICGRCKMIVKQGDVTGEISEKLTREEVKRGIVLACMTYVESDLNIEIPEDTLAKEKIKAEEVLSSVRMFNEGRKHALKFDCKEKLKEQALAIFDDLDEIGFGSDDGQLGKLKKKWCGEK